MRLTQRINLLAIQKKVGGSFAATNAIVARALIDTKNNVQVDPDNLPQTLTNLAGSTGAAPTLGLALKKASLTVATTGFTITANANGQDELIALNPSGTLATGTVVFPTGAHSRIGQSIEIISTHTQTALTLTTSGLTILGTAVTALTANTRVAFTKVAAATWIRTV